MTDHTSAITLSRTDHANEMNKKHTQGFTNRAINILRISHVTYGNSCLPLTLLSLTHIYDHVGWRNTAYAWNRTSASDKLTTFPMIDFISRAASVFLYVPVHTRYLCTHRFKYDVDTELTVCSCKNGCKILKCQPL